MVAPGHSLQAVQHQADERRVLLRLVGGRRANVADLHSDLATRLSIERVRRAIQALKKAGHAESDGHHTRPTWWLTAAGAQRARELQEAQRSSRAALPVLPEPITPATAFACTRRNGAVLTVSQCVGAWETRAEGLPCGLAPDGAETREGCPVGKRASEALRAKEAAREEAKQQASREREAKRERRVA